MLVFKRFNQSFVQKYVLLLKMIQYQKIFNAYTLDVNTCNYNHLTKLAHDNWILKCRYKIKNREKKIAYVSLSSHDWFIFFFWLKIKSALYASIFIYHSTPLGLILRVTPPPNWTYHVLYHVHPVFSHTSDVILHCDVSSLQTLLM